MKAVPVTAGELARRLNCRFEGSGDLVLAGAATIEDAGPEQLTFLANPRYRRHLPNCRAGAIIISADEKTPPGVARIVSTQSYQDFRRALEILYPLPDEDVGEGVHPLALVHPAATLARAVRVAPFAEIAAGATIGEGCLIRHGAYIGRDARLGERCVIGIGAVIRHEVVLGNRVVIGDGSVMGYDGFGYAPGEEGYSKIPQVGTVEIEDDVEVGANCCIDRATVGVTRVGRGSKLDNLIQIAHGVRIGEHTVIAAQTGISGSARVGSRVMIGGQVGMVGHIEIGDRMTIGAQTGVSKSFDTGGAIYGYPARPISEQMRIDASLTQLPQLIKRVRELEKKLKEMSRD